MALRALFAAGLAALWVAGAAAQETGTPELQVLPGGFLVIDQEALFKNSAFGQRILLETDQATKDLVAENRQIEAKLVAEEKDLTDRRPGLPADQFRLLADAFDEKVQQIREEQSQKSDAIGATLDKNRREFFQAIIPVLAEILRETHAVAILDKRTVLISVNLIDATALAVSRIDQRLGDGASTSYSLQPPAGDAAPQPDDAGAAPDSLLNPMPKGDPAPAAGASE